LTDAMGADAPVLEPDALDCACCMAVYANGVQAVEVCEYARVTDDKAHVRRALRFQAAGYKLAGDGYRTRKAREAAQRRVGT